MYNKNINMVLFNYGATQMGRSKYIMSDTMNMEIMILGYYR